MYFEMMNVDVEHKHITYIIENSCKAFCLTLPSGRIFCSDGTFLSEKAVTENNETPFSVTFNIENDGTVQINNRTCLFFHTNPSSYIPEDGDICVNADKIIGLLITAGSRCEGDTLTLPKRKCTKSLKKLFNELKIPADKRGSLTVFKDSAGIIAVEGISADARCSAYKAQNLLVMRFVKE